MRRSIVLVPAVLLIASLVAPSVGAQTTAPLPNGACGLTTLDATLEVNPGTGVLECAPGQPLVVREDLAPASEGRSAVRDALTSFFAIADVQLADEESPARAESGADPCYPSPGISSSAFRPHETMVPHLMNAHVRAANAIAASGSPHLGDAFDFLVGLGDLADNQQFNEIRWIIDLLDGGRLIDPDTGNDPVLGGEGYHGPQADDPRGGNGRSAPATSAGLPAEDVLELANEPFWAMGLRVGNDHAAEQLPWYSLPGNHDVKVQGTLPDEVSGRDHNEMKAWRAIYRAYYVGNAKVVLQDLDPERKQKLCEAFESQDQSLFIEAMTELLSDPAGTAGHKIIPSDQARMPLYRSQQIKQSGDEEACLAVATPARPLASEICRSSWIDEHRNTSGFPIGHGYGVSDSQDDSPRCTDADGNLLARACYSFTDDQDLFHYIALDSNPPEGAESGNIDPDQFEWLERELKAHSTTYFDAAGNRQTNPNGTDHLIVVFAHHPSASMNNEFAPVSPSKTEDEFRELLLRFPNVILNANGHTHQNRVWARSNEALGTGYWEVNTSAIADYPTQSRTIEIANNNDGTLSIFATVFDAFVAPDAADIGWATDDPTSESALSHGHVHTDINEDWLASWGREVMFHDPQQSLSKLGVPADRNVELLIETPFDLTKDAATSIAYTGETSEQVGGNLDAVARLTTVDGAPVAGATLTFQRDGETVASVTDADGVATATLKVHGPPTADKPITITFAGSDGYLPTEITVPFEARAGRKTTKGAIPGPIFAV
jgi:3',5'-cyclic AMP phosphodiesterase CpdA